jgi:hypothetical protein
VTVALARLLVIGSCLAAVAGCGAGTTDGVGAPGAPRTDGSYDYDEWGTGDYAVPTWSFGDWVSYADQVSVVTVVAERQLPLGPEEIANDEGYVGRTVTLELERTIWRRPGAPEARTRLTVLTWGWILNEGRMGAMVPGGARLEVGHRYVLPLARFTAEGKSRWSVFADGDGNFPLDGAVIVDGQIGRESPPGDDSYPGTERLGGMTVDELAARLAAAKPDPLAVEHAKLDPIARWEAVARACSEC